MDFTALGMPLIIITIGFGVIGLAFGTFVVFTGRDKVGERIIHYLETPSRDQATAESTNDPALNRFRRRFNLIFSRLNSEEMQRKLVAANWSITVSEFWFIRVGAALISLLIGLLLFRNLFSGIGLAIVAYMIPGFLLFRKIQERQKLFQNQLIDSLTLIRGAVSAGYSFQQSLNVVIQEMGSPTADEFRQVRKEVELGLPLNRALTNMANRMESDDFNLVATVLIINTQVGGNLTTILNVVIETIRQRVNLFSEMRSLTAYANFASYLLTILPVITMVVFSLLSPVYWNQLFEPGVTRFVLIYAACSLVVGNIVLRRISKVNV